MTRYDTPLHYPPISPNSSQASITTPLYARFIPGHIPRTNSPEPIVSMSLMRISVEFRKPPPNHDREKYQRPFQLGIHM